MRYGGIYIKELGASLRNPSFSLKKSKLTIRYMAHNPKLEVYQVWLNPLKGAEKTFRDFFIETLPSEESLIDSDNSFIYLEFFRDFIKRVDTDKFISDNKKHKAFTAYDTRPAGTVEPSINIHSERFIVEGTIEGGRYGQRRNKSNLGNKESKEDVEKTDIILDKFYFCLYTPLNSDLGILFVQSYSADSISDIFTDFIEGLFSKQGLYKKAKVERFVPRRIVEEFKNHSDIKKFTFSSRFVFNQLTNEPIGIETEEFIIKIEAIAKKGLNKESLGNWISAIGSKMFSNKKLNEFPKGKVYLQDSQTKKESPFDISSDIDIKPIIYLEERITIDEDGIPNFEELKEYCINLLQSEIIPEMYPSNAVTER